MRNPLTRERERATTILFYGIVLFLGYLFLRIVAIPGPPSDGQPSWPTLSIRGTRDWSNDMDMRGRRR